jgi:hypothetical protein
MPFYPIIEEYTPPTPDRLARPVRPIINAIVTRYNATSSPSRVHPRIAYSSVGAHKNAIYGLKTQYPLSGYAPTQKSVPTGGTIFMNEIWMGLPPLLTWDQGQDDFKIYESANGYPFWWDTLRNEGYRRVGPGIFLTYPGGVEAYFNRFVRPNLDFILFSHINRVAAESVPYNQWLLFNLNNPVVTAANRKAIRDYTGVIIWNTEAFYPYRRPHVLDPVYDGNGNPFYVVGAYLEGFKQAMESSLGGRYGTDFSHKDLVEAWDNCVLGPHGIISMVVRYLRRQCPLAKISNYDWPIGVSFPAIANYGGGRHDLLVEEEASGEIDAAFTQFHYLTSSFGYLPSELVADSVTDFDRSKYQPYSEYLYWRSGPATRSAALRERLNMPCYPFVKLTGPDTSIAGRTTGISTLSHKANAYLLELADADGIFVWDEVGDPLLGPIGAYLEDQYSALQSSSKEFDAYWGPLAKTAVSPALV